MILTDQGLLEIRINLEELITEREAMLALNQGRIHRGEQVGYDDGEFYKIVNQMKALRENLIHLGEK